MKSRLIPTKVENNGISIDREPRRENSYAAAAMPASTDLYEVSANSVCGTARRRSIEDARTSLLSAETPEAAWGRGTGGAVERLLVVIGSESTRARCLEFVRRFSEGTNAEIYVMKPASADPAGEVRRMAIVIEADWLCMVTHDRPGLMSLFLTSDDENILRTAPCPVVCIPEFRRPDHKTASVAGDWQSIKRVLVPIRSRGNRTLMKYAVTLTKRFKAKIDLLGVEEFMHKSFDSSARSLEDMGRTRHLAIMGELVNLADNISPKHFRGRKSVSVGLPLFHATTSAAQKLRSDLIVLTSPTRLWKARSRVDFRTERILRGASCPVVCIPERALRVDTAPNRELSATVSRETRP